jgi:hypothetical protein
MLKMEQCAEFSDGYFLGKNIENLLLMAVLGDESLRQKARAELQRRRLLNCRDDFEDSFMTNLSVV